jgi:Arc/MetJ family transcription regulator
MRGIYSRSDVYTLVMGKHLVDIDETALYAARSELGTHTIKETVNRALSLAGKERERKIEESLDRLAQHDFLPREQAWR